MIAPLILFHTGLARHHADWNWHNVRSPFARIYYIVEGHAQVLLPNRKLDLRARRMYLIPPYTTHHYLCAMPTNVCNYATAVSNKHSPTFINIWGTR